MFATDQWPGQPPSLVQTITTLQLISDIFIRGIWQDGQRSNILSFTSEFWLGECWVLWDGWKHGGYKVRLFIWDFIRLHRFTLSITTANCYHKYKLRYSPTLFKEIISNFINVIRNIWKVGINPFNDKVGEWMESTAFKWRAEIILGIWREEDDKMNKIIFRGGHKYWIGKFRTQRIFRGRCQDRKKEPLHLYNSFLECRLFFITVSIFSVL